ncbi:Oidioi.mRNA.OKI2018_I69.PAR.g9724.t1.cds [Oikopleura dioica]|uniref:Oidioi.mRNA.OKI2018_I69.PAR.g9724.t1.cds n=1 Tax=Oikopleura dioica TaxID=34765 RepID=A0ABN7RQK3_OIKDI|nr:Oidioi.mRNA.OKI2018_I69.PAR.g9724.t1.cds [Oikopleura dioica]
MGIFIIIEILVLLQHEAHQLTTIWKTRKHEGGLWALLACMIISGFEVVLGFSAFGAWLRYNDLVDKFKARNMEIELGLAYPTIYGHYLSKWNSSESGLNRIRKSAASYGDFSENNGENNEDDGDDYDRDVDQEIDNYAEMDAEMDIAMNEELDVDDGMDDGANDLDAGGDI